MVSIPSGCLTFVQHLNIVNLTLILWREDLGVRMSRLLSIKSISKSMPDCVDESFLYFVLFEAVEFPAQSHISTEELCGLDKTGEVLSRHGSLVYKMSQQSAFV